MSSTNSTVQPSAWLSPALVDNPEPDNGWLTAAPETVENIEIPAPTGPTEPQPGIPAPAQGLPVVARAAAAPLWVVGAHGGSGETLIAALNDEWVASDHSWPAPPGAGPVPCVVVARTHVSGLLAAQAALTQWASAAAGLASVVGLVLVADAPGKLPAPLRDLAKVVAGGAPRVWEVPWNESWRLGDPVTERMPRSVSKIVSQLGSLAATVLTVTDSSTTKE